MLELKGRTTLALLHFQKDICKPEGRLAPDDADALDRYAAAIQNTKGLLDIARQVGVPVVHSAFGRKRDGHFANSHGRMLNWIYQAGGCIEGDDGHAFVEELSPDPDEVVVRGSGLSAYGDSSFAEVLDKLEVETLVVAGITTHWAVEGTVRIAADYGLNCVVVADCVASAVVENHESALERLGSIAHILTAENIIETLSEA